jgi:hypothetical protein
VAGNVTVVNPHLIPPLILQYGMKRSGNHAISAWLTQNIPCKYINNLVPIGPVLKDNLPYPELQDFEKFKKQHDKADALFVSLEDIELDYEPFYNIDADAQKVLIIRHPDNVFSSRIRKAFNVNMTAYPKDNSPIMQRAVRIWKDHARCYLGQSGPSGRTAIYFDAWLDDDNYQTAILKTLGFDSANAQKNTMTDYGGGSSFDGLKFESSPKKMQLRERAALLNPIEKSLLDEIYQDEELQSLRTEIEAATPIDLLRI